MANIDHVNVGTTPYGFDAAALEGRDLDGVMATVGFHHIIIAELPGITSLPATFAVEGITAAHELTQKRVADVDPGSSMADEWGYSTGAGTVTITGTFSGSTSTTVTATFGIPVNKVIGVLQS